MLQLRNTTPFAAAINLFPDEEGIDSLFIAVKGTFGLHPSLHVAEKQVPLALKDEFRDSPQTSSLKKVVEAHLQKPGTDLVLLGNACAPEAKKVTELDVRFSVGTTAKTVRAFGNRHWRGGVLGDSISPPEPFTILPLVYELAYGGAQVENEEYYAEPANPVGIGFRKSRSGGDGVEFPLPNLEDPRQLMRGPEDRVTPAGFGWIAPSWAPRRSYAGTYDETWKRERAPFLPHDFDVRFFNAAHPDLVCPKHLHGGEPVEVLNASPAGPLRFNLPVCRLRAEVNVNGRLESPPFCLETVLLEPDERRLCLLWRSKMHCDKKALQIREVAVEVQKLEGVGAL